MELRLKQLKSAVTGLEEALTIGDDFSPDPKVNDLLNNGKIQKFECCIELCWKTIKVFLEKKKESLQKHLSRRSRSVLQPVISIKI